MASRSAGAPSALSLGSPPGRGRGLRLSVASTSRNALRFPPQWNLLRAGRPALPSTRRFHGKPRCRSLLPAILAVPFDDRLLSLGVQRAVGVSLFETGSLSLAQGAKLAGLSMEDFVALLGREGVPAVDYPPEELTEELEAAR